MCVLKEYLAGEAGYDDIHRPVLTWEADLPPKSLACALRENIRRGWGMGAGYDDIHRPVLTGE